MDNKEILNKLYQGCAALLGPILNDEEPQYDRIIFMGSHGTGKTTLANELSSMIDMPVVESVAREFFKDWKYLEDTKMLDGRMPKSSQTEVKQNILCSMSRWDFMRWVKAEIPCIMTRCPLDTLAYGFADPLVSDNLMNTNVEILKESQEFCKAIERSLFIYLPIEFAIEDDGVRPMDKMFQKNVDTYMRKLMYEFHIAPLVVTGSVEERLMAILVKIAGSDLAKIIMKNYKEEHK